MKQIIEIFTEERYITIGTTSCIWFPGGTLLTIQGSGFGGNVTVGIGDHVCEVTSANYSFIECMTPAQNTSGSQPVVVSEGMRSDDGGNLMFDYLTELTAVVTHLSTSIGSVYGMSVVKHVLFVF